MPSGQKRAQPFWPGPTNAEEKFLTKSEQGTLAGPKNIYQFGFEPELEDVSRGRSRRVRANVIRRSTPGTSVKLFSVVLHLNPKEVHSV